MIKLGPGEKIQKVVRKHWIIFFRNILSVIILLILPLLLLPFIPDSISLSRFIPSEEEIIVPITLDANFLIFAFSAWALLLWMRIFWLWTDFYLDVWVVTNRRIIAVEQKGVFSRRVANLRLDFIQDVTFSVNGMIPTFFDYGSIEVQSAGEAREFLIEGVHHPEKLRDLLQQEQKEAKGGGNTVDGVEFEEDEEFNRMINKDD